MLGRGIQAKTFLTFIFGFKVVFSMHIRVLYMSFDKFLLAVKSRDLSQADKSIIRVSSFPKMSNG